MLKSIQEFVTKVNNFDLWPVPISYAPIAVYTAFNAIKVGSPFYYFLANPGIETGGMLTESKYNILKQLPKEQVPKTTLVETLTLKEVLSAMQKEAISFPIVLKPNYGERGRFVERLANERELKKYIQKAKHEPTAFILQEYVNLPLEVGVFYCRYPNEKKGKITSFISKDIPHIIGDGKSTVEELMMKDSRTRIQLKDFKDKYKAFFKKVPKKGEHFIITHIASHNRGTIFNNRNAEIDKQLTDFFDKFSKNVKGFYYGRYDIRTTSIEDLKKGNFKVIELNGAKAEPTHIYDPNYPLSKAYKDLFSHWKHMFEISKQNKAQGHKYPTFKEGLSEVRRFKKLRN